MPIRAEKNLYPGVNPHLNSFLQHKTGWKGFHSQHLADIAHSLEILLPDSYYLANEESLQIGTYDLQADTPVGKANQTVTDITIRQREQSTKISSSLNTTSMPTLTLPIAEITDEEEYVNSLVIYVIDEGEFPGRPVTRIELLSPANKPRGSHYDAYVAKRRQTLQSGLRLVEIDYLHERQPVISRILSYSDQQEGAFPYNIIVNDPTPTFWKGKIDVFGFGVLETLPTVPIPLFGEDHISLNFSELYNRTIESSRLFRSVLVDYEQEPVNFEAYTPADQELIKNHMAAVAMKYATSES